MPRRRPAVLLCSGRGRDCLCAQRIRVPVPGVLKASLGGGEPSRIRKQVAEVIVGTSQFGVQLQDGPQAGLSLIPPPASASTLLRLQIYAST